MATLFLMFYITTTISAPTTLVPTNTTISITTDTQFELCTKLNLAGCGINTMNDLIRNYVNSQVQSNGYDYSLPYDPCEFKTINMSWILSLSDLSLLSTVTASQVLTDMPCELYIQMPDTFLSELDLSAITTDEYWFGANAQCVYNSETILNCSDPNRPIINYTESQTNNECFYPFVASHYKTPIHELYEAGLENCGLSCDYIPYSGDINKLDNFNYASALIAVIFNILFFFNITFEVRKAYKGKTKFSELPLTFDIPVIISLWMFVLTVILGVSAWNGKEYFACERGTNAAVADVKRDNTHCYIAGQFIMVSISSMYLYCSLLAFSIWRSLANPFKPLFGLHKVWFHILLNIIVLGYYIGAMSEDIFSSNPVTGICGPNITGDYGIKYLFTPLIFDISTFVIFTILSVYRLWLHFQNQKKKSSQERAIANLAIRLVIYSAFIAASLICFLYMSGRFITDGDEWHEDIANNINCLLTNELFGTSEECELDLIIEDDVYWTQGITCILVSIASFVLSCSNQRYTDYSKMKQKMRKTTQSGIHRLKTMGSVMSNGDDSHMQRYESSKSSKSSKVKKKKRGETDRNLAVKDNGIESVMSHSGVSGGSNGKSSVKETEMEAQSIVSVGGVEMEMTEVDRGSVNAMDLEPREIVPQASTETYF